MPDTEILDGRALAKMFGCSYSQIKKHTERGTIPCFRIGVLVRYRRSDIEKYIDEQVKRDVQKEKVQ